MTQATRTAKIPMFEARLGGPISRLAGQGGETDSPSDASSDRQWEKLSEQTLQRLRQRVREVSQKDPGTLESTSAGFASAERVPDSQAAGFAIADAPGLVERSAVADAEPSLAEPEDDVSMTIRSMVDLVTQRSAEGVPAVLLFIGSEPNVHTDETAARLATALCDRTESRVLLIDSDTESRNLTAAARLSAEEGMTEVIQRNRNWQSLLLRNETANLDFLPCGREVYQRWNQQELLRKAACEMRKNYQFICVSVGDAHSQAARLWSDVCDGSFLLVSVKNSNPTIAKSAVTELQSSGSRLLGCIVTDVE